MYEYMTLTSVVKRNNILQLNILVSFLTISALNLYLLFLPHFSPTNTTLVSIFAFLVISNSYFLFFNVSFSSVKQWLLSLIKMKQKMILPNIGLYVLSEFDWEASLLIWIFFSLQYIPTSIFKQNLGISDEYWSPLYE